MLEHLFLCLLVICMSSLEQCLFGSSVHFLIGFGFFWYWAAWAACIFWRLSLCQLFHLLLFSPILKAAFSLGLQFPSLCKSLKSLIRSLLFYFVFISITQGDGSKRILLWFMSESVLPRFSPKSFIVSGLTFRSIIHFEFTFVYGVRQYSSFIHIQVVDQFSQHHLLKRLSFLHCIFLPPLSKVKCP